ncbi:winged helix-turn-helix domain-containing protein [Burkholderia ubonensis]|uniref:winged helix-turn-helix domain-containing protein n=1 Tax=Burkholderia ubonensis TaxID=101571 RepID=UPI0012F9A97B|nr:winged helix-turn-helix domain-containing protein [Burkholderia ubonensis]
MATNQHSIGTSKNFLLAVEGGDSTSIGANSNPRKYIINNTIEFNPRTRTISLISKPDPIFLAPITSRLFALFCAHPGEIIYRKFIMDEIWTRHGIVVSENTLTKAVSHLRGNLNSVGELACQIEALNRIGYIFVADVLALA